MRYRLIEMDERFAVVHWNMVRPIGQKFRVDKSSSGMGSGGFSKSNGPVDSVNSDEYFTRENTFLDSREPWLRFYWY